MLFCSVDPTDIFWAHSHQAAGPWPALGSERGTEGWPFPHCVCFSALNSTCLCTWRLPLRNSPSGGCSLRYVTEGKSKSEEQVHPARCFHLPKEWGQKSGRWTSAMNFTRCQLWISHVFSSSHFCSSFRTCVPGPVRISVPCVPEEQSLSVTAESSPTETPFFIASWRTGGSKEEVRFQVSWVNTSYSRSGGGMFCMNNSLHPQRCSWTAWKS